MTRRRRPRVGAIAIAGGLAIGAMPAAAIDTIHLIERLENLRTRHGIAGVGLVIVADGRVVHEGGLGIADRATGRPVDRSTRWRIGSITKSFTAVATLIAAREQGFAIDAPLRALVPDAPFSNPWEATDPVRVVHLLEHTAGFLDLGKREFDSSDPSPLSLAQAFAVDPGSREVRWPPGRYSSYSNTGAGLAALVIEARTGKTFEAFVEQRILEPLGMADSAFGASRPTRGPLATGYDRDGRTPIPYWHTLYRAFGGLDTNLGDMGRYVRWLLAPANVPLAPTDVVLRLERPNSSLGAAAGLSYGYGLGLYGYTHDGMLLAGHGGDADGYLSRVGLHRPSGRGYFLVINAFHGEALAAMQAVVEDALLEGLSRPDPPSPGQLGDAELRTLTGCYVPVTRRFPVGDVPEDPPLQVIIVDDRLVTVNPQGFRRALVPVTGRLFRREDEPVATSAFVDDGGTLMLQGDMGNLRRAGDAGSPGCAQR